MAQKVFNLEWFKAVFLALILHNTGSERKYDLFSGFDRNLSFSIAFLKSNQEKRTA